MIDQHTQDIVNSHTKIDGIGTAYCYSQDIPIQSIAIARFDCSQ